MAEAIIQQIGSVKGFFAKPSAAVLELTAELRVGDRIYIRGHTTDFQQAVDSMQYLHQAIEHAAPGQIIGVRVQQPCRKHDLVYKLSA